ncbi:hypothetical protein Lal_00034738 [Lupinus albus]|nr:hypothetical protein Lal_00034738 [Lupinus albus]
MRTIIPARILTTSAAEAIATFKACLLCSSSAHTTAIQEAEYTTPLPATNPLIASSCALIDSKHFKSETLQTLRGGSFETGESTGSLEGRESAREERLDFDTGKSYIGEERLDFE